MLPRPFLYAAREFVLSDRLFRAFSRYGTALAFPLGLQIQTQNRCNGRCAICPYSRTVGREPRYEMPESLFLKIAREAASEPLFSSLVFMLQNEPLLDGRLFSWIGTFKTLNPGKKAVIITNGERLQDFSLSEIAKSDVDEIVVSLNAHTAETFGMLHQGLNYQKVRENIDWLLADARLRRKVAVSYILTRQNQAELAEALRYWRRQRVPVLVGGLENRGGALKNFTAYSMPPQRPGWRLRRKVYQWYLRTARGARVCQTPLLAMYILCNGDVILCCSDWQHEPIMGSLQQYSIRQVWNSAPMQQARALLRRGAYHALPACRECSIAADILAGFR